MYTHVLELAKYKDLDKENMSDSSMFVYNAHSPNVICPFYGIKCE